MTRTFLSTTRSWPGIVAAAALLAASVVAGLSAPATGATDLTLKASSGEVAPAALPPRSVRHKNSEFWVWFGPRSWQSVDSKQGIRITSANGLLDLDYGFSSTICASGQTLAQSVNAYFTQHRAQLRQSLRAAWRRPTLRTSGIRQLPARSYGNLYFRESYAVSGRAGGIRFRGEIQSDYSLASGPTYCFVRDEARTAPRAGYRTSIRQLRSVQNALAYFGPGAPDEEGFTDPVR